MLANYTVNYRCSVKWIFFYSWIRIDIFMTKTAEADPQLSDEKTVKALNIDFRETQIGLHELNTKLQGKGKLLSDMA